MRVAHFLKMGGRFHDSSPEVRGRAVEVLSGFGPPAVPPLAYVLEHDPDPGVRFRWREPYWRWVTGAKHDVPDMVLLSGILRRSCPVLDDCLNGTRSRSSPMRPGRPECRRYEILIRSFDEGAAAVLGQIGPAAKDAVPALVQSLGDPNPFVRGMAARALGGIGRAANAAIPALIQALQDLDTQSGE